MQQKLHSLAENNTVIVTLVKPYTTRAKTPAFNVEAEKFRNYASAWLAYVGSPPAEPALGARATRIRKRTQAQ